MPRIARYAPGGLVYHVLNRAKGRVRLFKKPEDYLAFQRVLLEAHGRVPRLRILSWCLMPDHWHLVLWPRRDGELKDFMRWLTLTHTQRWKHAHAAVGRGRLYQERFKSFPIQQDEHLLTVLRYVEANPRRAKLVKRAEQWHWGSCRVRRHPDHDLSGLLSEWPVHAPADWLALVNEPQEETEQAMVRVHLERSRPLGSERWVLRTAAALHLEHTLHSRGRPVGWRKPRPEEGNAGSRHR